MLAGEVLPECAVCNDQLLNTDVYRSYFNHMFGHKWPEVVAHTDSSGATSLRPISWDYRFSNLCNFKCRMCGDMLSSSWESEQRQHDLVDLTQPKNRWMQPAIREQITRFQDTQIEQEFSAAVEAHSIEEVYWVGGEPLMYEQHWRYMRRIIELGDGGRLYARYNTNLSRTRYMGCDLYSDILAHVRDWQICASLDGTGAVGEWIRTGLDYGAWRRNFARGLDLSSHRRQMRIDFTLTLPGLFEILKIEQLAREFDVDILAKVVFSFTPEIVLSPLALPRPLLQAQIDRLLDQVQTQVMRDLLTQLRTRPTHEEQWPETWQAGLIQGKQRQQQLERIRADHLTLGQILAQDPDIGSWYDAIAA